MIHWYGHCRMYAGRGPGSEDGQVLTRCGMTGKTAKEGPEGLRCWRAKVAANRFR